LPGTDDRKELLTNFSHHFKNVMASGKPWSIESAVESFLNNNKI
jgi:hypothetical protein